MPPPIPPGGPPIVNPPSPPIPDPEGAGEELEDMPIPAKGSQEGAVDGVVEGPPKPPWPMDLAGAEPLLVVAMDPKKSREFPAAGVLLEGAEGVGISKVSPPIRSIDPPLFGGAGGAKPAFATGGGVGTGAGTAGVAAFAVPANKSDSKSCGSAFGLGTGGAPGVGVPP
mmetsp:Transcript_83585/g.183801  ORF Transcript_83585/g.183801 Transcript_83585/m.183801 type:complete len:169 (-) Transcript_83585:1841-2347(-)